MGLIVCITCLGDAPHDVYEAHDIVALAGPGPEVFQLGTPLRHQVVVLGLVHQVPSGGKCDRINAKWHSSIGNEF